MLSVGETTMYHSCVAADPTQNCEPMLLAAEVAGNVGLLLAALAAVGLAVMIVAYRLREKRGNYGS